MALLIDGYNLLHVTGIFGEGRELTALHRSRQALLNFLAAAIEPKELVQTTIVFDAGSAPPGLPRSLDHHGITVLFARGFADADEMIEDLLERHKAPRSLLVVSADHRVQRAARRCQAKWIDSATWYAELLAARRADDALRVDAPAKPIGDLSPEEIAYWTNKFADPAVDDAAERATPREESTPPADDLDNPFPPGYADDLLDDFPEHSEDEPR